MSKDRSRKERGSYMSANPLFSVDNIIRSGEY